MKVHEMKSKEVGQSPEAFKSEKDLIRLTPSFYSGLVEQRTDVGQEQE